jgi:hypothetical protein
MAMTDEMIAKDGQWACYCCHEIHDKVEDFERPCRWDGIHDLFQIGSEEGYSDESYDPR